MANLFRRSLFGYNKKDVLGYVEKISADFQERIDECKKEIDGFSKKREELDAMRAEIEKEKSAVSEAIVSAHEKAGKIVADARDKAQEAQADMQRKIEEENRKLIKIRREIYSIRRNAIKTLSNLEADDEETETEE